MLSQSENLEKEKIEGPQKWLKYTSATGGANYDNQDKKANLRVMHSYFDDTHLTFYIRIYHNPDAIKTKALIAQLEKRYHEKIAEIKIPCDGKKNDWVKPEEMRASSREHYNYNLPRLKITEKEYHGQYTLIELTTPDKRYIGEFIHIIDSLFDIREIYDDLFKSLNIKPLFDDINAIKAMVFRKEYAEAIDSALETSQYIGYETTLFDLGRYFEELEKFDLAFEAYQKIPEKNICFEKAQQIIIQMIAKKAQENEKRFSDAKEDINKSIENIKTEVSNILSPYLGIKNVNTLSVQLISLAKDTYKALYLEDKEIWKLRLKMGEVINEINVNVCLSDILLYRGKIVEKAAFFVNIYLLKNPDVDEFSLRNKVNKLMLSFTKSLDSIEKIGEVTVRNFSDILEAFGDRLDELLDLHHKDRFFPISDPSISDQIEQCINSHIKNKEFRLSVGGIDSDDDILNHTIKLTRTPFALFKKSAEPKQNDKEYKLPRSRSF